MKIIPTKQTVMEWKHYKRFAPLCLVFFMLLGGAVGYLWPHRQLASNNDAASLRPPDCNANLATEVMLNCFIDVYRDECRIITAIVDKKFSKEDQAEVERVFMRANDKLASFIRYPADHPKITYYPDWKANYDVWFHTITRSYQQYRSDALGH